MTDLQIRGIHKAFGDPPRTVLEPIDLTLEGGSFTAIVGPSGCGKTTLLRIVGGLVEPTSGTVTVGNRTPHQARRDKEVGWMAQRPALLPWRTVEDNISLAQAINPRPRRGLLRPTELLEMVGLADAARSFPGQLSGGMQQRAALARTLAIGASLWLMDEPFSSLDELTREALGVDLLEIWSRFRPTTLWITHHIPEAVTLADRIVVMTRAPGSIAGIVDVDLPRPREATSPQFQEVVRQTRALLWDSRPQEVVA